MSPPSKRRRLSGSKSQSSHSDFMPEGPSPTLLHSVEQLQHKPRSTTARTVPHHIEEVHLQIQRRAIGDVRKGDRGLHPRQAPAVESDVTTIDALGQTTVVEITIGATTTTPTPVGSTTPDSSSSSSNSSSSTTNISDSGGTTGLGGSRKCRSQIIHEMFVNWCADNGTATHTSTKDSTGTNSGHTTLLSSVYVATLTDHHKVTVTRATKPYKTTFADGQVSTICDRTGDCKLEADKNTQTEQTPDSASTSSTMPSGVTSTAFVAGATPGQPTTSSPSSSTAASVQHNSSNTSTPPPGTIAGGVVGGAAGLAVILLIALILLRWYKRRRQHQHQALPPSSIFSSDQETSSSRGPGMAERAGIRPLAGAVPGFFRHQNRSDIEPPPSERSFQKVSGRKLPSAFSEGMTSAAMGSAGPSVPSTAQDRNLSSLSFYRDSQGFYGGDGDAADRSVSPDDVPPLQSDNTGVLLSPGPQRTPTLHTGGPYIMTPSSSVPSTPHMQSPNLATIPGSPTELPRTINRSSTPSTVDRSSRFTEEV